MEKRPLRVFLDSNVILSGLISDKGAPRIILDLLCLSLPILVGMTCRYNLAEIERNIQKMLPAALPFYKTFLRKLHLRILPLPSADEAQSVADFIARKDAPVLAAALKGKADFLVTGDKKDFGRLKEEGLFPTRVVGPSEFLEALEEELTERGGTS